MKNNEKIKDLVLGEVIQKDKGKDIPKQKEKVFLDDEARKSNLLIISTKNSGKSNTLIPYMYLQDIKNENAGLTFFIGRSRLAFYLYTIAKENSRKVRLIKPSVDKDVLDKLIYSKYNSKDLAEYINTHIIDYAQAIRNKEIIIIDMEYERYSLLSYKANVALLLQLQEAMAKEEVTLKRRHYVYIDEAYRYLEYLSNLLQYGDDYNVSTTLFFGSRSQFISKGKDYTSLIDINVRNTLLLQGITYEDAIYYSKRIDLPEVHNPDRYFNEAQIKDLMNRKYGEFTYEILGKEDYVRKIGVGQLYKIATEDVENYERKAERYIRKFKKGLDDSNELTMLKEKEKFDKEVDISNEKRNETSFIDKAVKKDINKHDYKNENKIDNKQEDNNYHKERFNKREDKILNKDNKEKVITKNFKGFKDPELPSSYGDLSKELIEKMSQRLSKQHFQNKKEEVKQKIENKKVEENKDIEDDIDFDGYYKKDFSNGGFYSDEKEDINASKPEDINVNIEKHNKDKDKTESIIESEKIDENKEFDIRGPKKEKEEKNSEENIDIFDILGI